MRKHFLYCILSFATSFSYAGSVYKCETSAGMVYQSSPCPVGAKKLATACVKNSDYYSNVTGNVNFDGENCETKYNKEKAKRDALKAKREAEWNAMPEPKIGMTRAEVEGSKWGFPNKVNSTTSKYGESEQWVYNDEGYLYFTNGILTTIQKR